MRFPWTPTGETRRLDRSVWQPPPESQPIVRLLGDGPPEASTSHTIERQPFVWDGNGFYRRLGLAPGATRRQVATAYMALDGQRSSRLTTAARTLIDKSAKRSYDAMALGNLWPDDENLVEGVLAGDIEKVAAVNAEWSVYAYRQTFDKLLPATTARINTWRCMLALVMWRCDMICHFAMGIADFGTAAIVGYRKVIFVPLDMEPNWQYAADLVVLLSGLDDG